LTIRFISVIDVLISAFQDQNFSPSVLAGFIISQTRFQNFQIVLIPLPAAIQKQQEKLY